MDRSFLQSLHLIALGIVKKQMDPWELVNGWVEYYLKNNNFHEIDGSMEIANISQKIEEILKV